MVDQIVTPEKGDPDYVDYVVNLARGRVMRDGIITEPRAIFDPVWRNPVNPAQSLSLLDPTT